MNSGTHISSVSYSSFKLNLKLSNNLIIQGGRFVTNTGDNIDTPITFNTPFTDKNVLVYTTGFSQKSSSTADKGYVKDTTTTNFTFHTRGFDSNIYTYWLAIGY